MLAAWARRYIGTDAAKVAGRTREARGGSSCSETGDGNFSRGSPVGPHCMIADEPVTSGGADTGSVPDISCSRGSAPARP